MPNYTGEYIGVDNLFYALITNDNNTKQLETATVAGTIGAAGAGDATVIITAAGMTGSPKTLSVAVANDDTAALVAGKIRAALALDAAVIALFTVGGTGATVTLEKIIPAATDSTLNISINNGTCTGLTPALTSVNTATGTGYVAGAPVALAPLASIAMEPANSTKTRYYDNIPYYVDTTEAETKVTVVVSGLDIQQQAILLGKTYDAGSKRLLDNGQPNAPYVALGFRTKVAGGYRYFWFLKGKFAPFKEEASTQTDATEEKTLSLEFTAATTTYAYFLINAAASSCKRVVGDDQIDTAITTVNWFDAVEIPAIYTA